MVEPSEIPLIVLYTDRRSAIEGATRFQKLVFLAQEEEGIPQLFDFEPYKFGPYSAELQGTINRLEEVGLIQRTQERTKLGNERYIYSITPEGIQRVQRLLAEEDPEELFEKLQTIKRRVSEWSESRLLNYVYRNYEAYTTESQLDADEIEDPYTERSSLEETPSEIDADEEFDEPLAEPTVSLSSDEQSLPAWVRTFSERAEAIPEVAEMYVEPRDDEPDRLITVLVERDFEAMDRLYDLELSTREAFPDQPMSFRVTVRAVGRYRSSSTRGRFRS